ncbi:MAG TPA: ScyD/ScyE family protein [Kofleriaceae bacterium]|nr:ScyD/ScyE family protein [Kofleriaceae bacterium]
MRRTVEIGGVIALLLAGACETFEPEGSLDVAEAGLGDDRVAAVARSVSAHGRRCPVVTRLAEFGTDDFVTGSTIGPDGALYVTDGRAGEVLRIDRRDGRVSTYATGFPPKAFQEGSIGGPVDVAFMGRTAYVLVSLVSGEYFGEPFGDPQAKNGLYRIEPDGTHTLVADLGQWSIDNPPQPAFFINTGLQFAMEPYWGGFLVTDGHHNRVLWVGRHGSIHELATFGNVVPTGIEVTAGHVFVTQLGPIPHHPEDGKVFTLGAGREPHEVASGASMLIDVERGPRGKLYGLSQGQWDGVEEGSRAEPNTGRLVVVGRHGDLTPVMDCDGQELVLDRPVSVEFVGNTAYVVSVTGVVYRVNDL